MAKYLLFLIFPFLLGANLNPSMEGQDLDGTTTHFNGTVGTTAIALPTVAGAVISEVLFKCPAQTPTTTKCLLSFDGGTLFVTLSQGEFIGWSTKGYLRQIHIKGSAAGVSYEMVMNREGW